MSHWCWNGSAPREHAVNILRLKTLEERRAYLVREVPEEFREWVSKLVTLWWPMRDKL